MAFERLQTLGEEEFQKILNLLMRGEPAMHVARTIQQEWHQFQDVAEKTLCQQLNRLRLAAAEGAFGMKAAKKIAEGATPQIRMLKDVSVGTLVRLEELSEIQKHRVLALVEKEKNMPLPIGAMLTATNMVFTDYKQLLLDIQKVRFDLGLDEFKGPTSHSIHHVKGGVVSAQLPDGTNVQKQVFEAVQAIEAVFDQRKIPEHKMKDVTP
jgi:hypothetical protein